MASDHVKFDIGSKNGNRLAFFIMDGNDKSRQWRYRVCCIEKRFRPVGRVSGKCLQEPFCLQIVLMSVSNDTGFHSTTVRTYGIRTEPVSLFGEIVIHKAQPATADTRIGLHDTPHDVFKTIRLTQMILDLIHTVYCTHLNIREHTANTLIRRLQVALIEFCLLFYNNVVR